MRLLHKMNVFCGPFRSITTDAAGAELQLLAAEALGHASVGNASYTEALAGTCRQLPPTRHFQAQ